MSCSVPPGISLRWHPVILEPTTFATSIRSKWDVYWLQKLKWGSTSYAQCISWAGKHCPRGSPHPSLAHLKEKPRNWDPNVQANHNDDDDDSCHVLAPPSPLTSPSAFFPSLRCATFIPLSGCCPCLVLDPSSYRPQVKGHLSDHLP